MIRLLLVVALALATFRSTALASLPVKNPGAYT